MQVNIQIGEGLISDGQAETFAYNIYRDVSEYLKSNFDEFFWWNLEEISICCIMTNKEIVSKKHDYNYELCKYRDK